jgi:hypothetical protein
MRHQVTARVPEADYRLLRALSSALQTSQAEVLTRGLMALNASLSPDVRRVVKALVTRPRP